MPRVTGKPGWHNIHGRWLLFSKSWRLWGQHSLPHLKSGEQVATLWAGTCHISNPRHWLTWAAEQGEKGHGQAPATKRGHLQ